MVMNAGRVEQFGTERFFSARWVNAAQDELLIVLSEESQKTAVPGSVVHVTLRADKIHFFNAHTGQRIEVSA